MVFPPLLVQCVHISRARHSTSTLGLVNKRVRAGEHSLVPKMEKLPSLSNSEIPSEWKILMLWLFQAGIQFVRRTHVYLPIKGKL